MTIGSGRVKALWRHPVKSMQGEMLDSAWFDDKGMLGDRAYAVLDMVTGIVASAKHPTKWGKLLTCRAAFIAEPEPGRPLPPIRIVFPDGTEGELGTAKDVRQEALGLAAPGTFLDFAPIHVLSTTTLESLAARAPDSRFDPRRFRPNILIEGDGLAEHEWPGSSAAVGPLEMKFIDPTPRCVMTTLAQADLPRDPAVFAAAASVKAPSITFAPGQMMSVIAGVHACAVNEGVVAVGDKLYGLT